MVDKFGSLDLRSIEFLTVESDVYYCPHSC